MTDLVRNHVRTREVARRAEALVQLLEERQIEVHLLIERTVERTDRGLRKPTFRLHCTTEQDELRLTVVLTIPAELLVPYILRLGQNDRDEVRLFVHALVRPRLRGCDLLCRRAASRH